MKIPVQNYNSNCWYDFLLGFRWNLIHIVDSTDSQTIDFSDFSDETECNGQRMRNWLKKGRVLWWPDPVLNSWHNRIPNWIRCISFCIITILFRIFIRFDFFLFACCCCWWLSPPCDIVNRSHHAAPMTDQSLSTAYHFSFEKY